MRTVAEHDFATYPRRFDAYKWYKPLLVGLLYFIFIVIFSLLLDKITEWLFSVTAVNDGAGYDGMDFFTAAGAFSNGASAAATIPCLILAALIVKDRPISSYFSSMGGWRWKVTLKVLLAGLIIIGIPQIIFFFLKGKSGDVLFTVGGFFILLFFIPLQGIAEEMLFRGFVMQTAGSWAKMAAVGVIVQTLIFMAVHPYNIIGIIAIAASAIVYALLSLYSKGIEASSIAHIFNNTTEIFMAGFGFGLITSDQTIMDNLFNVTLKVVYLLFIIYASKKLHWFDEVQFDDVAAFNSKGQKQEDSTL